MKADISSHFLHGESTLAAHRPQCTVSLHRTWNDGNAHLVTRDSIGFSDGTLDETSDVSVCVCVCAFLKVCTVLEY